MQETFALKYCTLFPYFLILTDGLGSLANDITLTRVGIRFVYVYIISNSSGYLIVLLDLCRFPSLYIALDLRSLLALRRVSTQPSSPNLNRAGVTGTRQLI